MPQTSPMSWATLSMMMVLLMCAKLPMNLIVGCKTSSSETPFKKKVKKWMW